MSKTDELKKLSEKLVGDSPDTRRASDVVEYIADKMSGENTENPTTISESIAYLTKSVGSGGGSSEEIEQIKEDIQYMEEDINYLYNSIAPLILLKRSGNYNEEISLNSTQVGTLRYLLGVYEGAETSYTETFRNNPMYFMDWERDGNTETLGFFINELVVTTDGSNRINTFRGSLKDLSYNVQIKLIRGSNNRYTGTIAILERD